MSSLPIPQFAWPAAAVTNTFSPTYPPVEKPGNDDVEAVKSRLLTVSGKVQTWTMRTDNFRHLNFKFVPQSDLPGWEAFLEFALTGDSFLYYPDSLATAYDEFWLEDAGGSTRQQDSNTTSSAAWNPNFAFRSMDEFELVIRKVAGGLTSP